MILAIVGSRSVDDYDYVCSVIDTYIQANGTPELIVSGGARGIDSLAERYAKEHNIPTKIFPAEWGRLGKSAGYVRNALIVDACTHVLAIYDGVSKGTAHTINLARQKNKVVCVQLKS
jgi:predicted Rossmann fold nucleotide-binding protein DprA/Smf involved in DNA uptake